MIEQQTPTAPLAWLLMRPPIRDASLPSRVHVMYDVDEDDFDGPSINDAVAEYLRQSRRAVTALEVSGALRLTPEQARSAIMQLVRKELVRRAGAGSAARYEWMRP